MIRVLIYCMLYLGCILMVYNNYLFIRFLNYVKTIESRTSSNAILYLSITLLMFFLAGYLAVTFFGKPDLIIAGILFGGSIFVYVMYKLLSGTAGRIRENERREAELQAAEENNRTKSSLLASISHEMRTPMNVILGLDTIALKNPDLDEETRDQLEKIGHSGRHMLSLINNVLDLNQIDTNQLEVQNSNFAMNDIITQIDAIIRTLCEEKGLEYEVSVADDVAENYIGDETMIRQVLLAILDNAVKYTDAPGKVTFAISKDEKDNICFRVADTGIGMSKEFMDKLFVPFEKEDLSSTENYGGMGLGLTTGLAKVRLMGGSIEAESQKNVGSVFTIRLPLKEADQTIDNNNENSDNILEGYRILIAEDLNENAEIVSDLLEMEGAASERAQNGRQAVEMFEKSPANYYDAILMDMRMPEMDGLSAAAAIRKLERPDSRSVVIIALSANTSKRDIEESRKAGMDSHLAKPIDPDSMYEKVKQLVDERKKVMK